MAKQKRLNYLVDGIVVHTEFLKEGEKIRIIPGSRIWICCEIDIEMTEEAMEEMMQEKLLYDFEQSLFYEECQRM